VITSLEIEHFKCFANLRLALGRLTLLTGFNGGGKSSAVQPLLLLAQAYRNAADVKQLALNGALVRLGTVGDILPAQGTGSRVIIRLIGDVEETEWVASARAGERHLVVDAHSIRGPTGAIHDNPMPPSTDGMAASLGRLSFLSAVREGTADAYPIPESASNGNVDVGVDGRFAPFWYGRCVDDEVPRARRHPNEPATSLRKQLDAWLSTLFPGAQANVQQFPQVSLESLQFRLSDIGSWRRPANVGYGFTYAFPILVALLAATESQIVVIDSPEAHLHPSAQSQMGRLLAVFAGAGVQIIVETHSDHLLNGARLAVKDRALSADAVRVHFFTGASRTAHGVVSPTLDAEGRIGEWPAGFFDQAETDLARLSGWV
jgi:CRISPR-associated Cas5-like protein